MRPLLIAAFLLAVPLPARAELFVIPFLGMKFGGSTSLFDVDLQAGAKKFTFGGSVMQVDNGILGFEGTFGSVPGYFEVEGGLIRPGSLVIDATGSVLFSTPAGMTGGGLRPYAAVGAGIIHAQSEEIINVLQVRRTMPAGILGVGVWGLITPTVGVRFDYRYLRSLTNDDGSLDDVNRSISYSRFTIGLVLRL